jgi:hypothetical protein
VAAGEQVVSDNMLLLAREFRNAKNDAQPVASADKKVAPAAATAASTVQAKP